MNTSSRRSRKITPRRDAPRRGVRTAFLWHGRVGGRDRCRMAAVCLFGILLLSCPGTIRAQLSVDEQHRIFRHREEDIVQYRRPPGAVPVTVASDDAYLRERLIPLDEAIRIALQHAEVIRVLTGVSATTSGRTIYDTAVATTPIDQAVARFDPVFSANSSWRKTELPGTRLDPADPLAALITGSQTGGNDLAAGLSKTNRLGGRGALEFRNNWNYGVGGVGALSPVHRPAFELSYTQPLLAGAGRAANEAPIVIARLELDRSYFQFKDSVQELVRGVIAGYWSLVEARTQLWAREKQVEQAQAALDRVEAQFRVDLVDIGDVAQPRVAYANFKANLVSARGSVIQREAALRNLLGLPPEDGTRLVPSTPPTRDRVEFDWAELVQTAQARRPDLMELHLILHADRQRLLQANNQSRPSLDAVAVHRWNGITGQMLNGSTIGSGLDDNPAWTMGINFEVPLGLRQARATARSRELLISRDRANIQQGLHATEHTLATNVRNLDQFYEQYEAFKETREAARVNLRVQFAEEAAGRAIFLNVLQAITDWGNAVSSEASSLTQYNATLAALERETGTILETHGIVFSEERFAAIGPFGRHFEPECYPKSLQANGNVNRYDDSGQAAEESFDLQDYPGAGRTSEPPAAPRPLPLDDASPQASDPDSSPPMSFVPLDIPGTGTATGIGTATNTGTEHNAEATPADSKKGSGSRFSFRRLFRFGRS
ncbi:MAG: TolC family protein [Fuerstiella sp.]